MRAGLEVRAWSRRRWSSPSPDFVKRTVLLRYSLPHATWVETGTYRGETTSLLAKTQRQVISIEPSPFYFARAERLLGSKTNLQLVNGSSETHFKTVVDSLSGEVCFWLDGHHSGGDTYLGNTESPILLELDVISRAKSQFSAIRVLVDDVRLFRTDESNSESGYPDLQVLTDFANSNGYWWTIEHDIFITGTSPRP